MKRGLLWWSVVMALPMVLAQTASARGISYGGAAAALANCETLQWNTTAARATTTAVQACYRALLTQADTAVRAEAAWALGDVKSANELFSAAVKQKATAQLLTRWGELYAETHQNSEALKLFEEALQKDADYAFAKVGAAAVLVDQFATQADEYLQAVIKSDTAPVGAKLRAYLLAARVNLENSDTARATALLKQATELATSAALPQLEIYALQASLQLLQSATGVDVPNSEWVKEALAVNPHWGDIYAIPAHYYVITRRTREAAELYKRAVEMQPDHWDARVEYGSSLLRDNQLNEAREQMQAAYAGDPYNPVTVNTLRLLDSLKNYDTLAYPELNSDAKSLSGQTPMILRLHKKESAVLGPYARKLTEQAVASFSQQFNFTLKEPVVIEVYPNHEDFAVRTAGEPGLGLLGVTFGYVVAMDSPSSRPVDEFHWGTTLWHELAHVFTLESTEHRVPRWFSEGVSVYVEWNSGPISGSNGSISIPGYAYKAFKEGKALPVAELDRGFIRPENQQQVMVSYMQAGLICEFIKRQYGAGKLNELLTQFKKGVSTEKAIEAVFKIKSTEFDTRFTAFMNSEFKTLFDKFDAWNNARATVAAAYQRKEWDSVIQAANEALSILPNDVEESSPYVPLARAYNASNQADKAQSTLDTYFKRGGHNPEALQWLAKRLVAQGKLADAAKVYDAINYVTPFDYEIHGALGEVLLSLKQHEAALAEFQAALKLNPPDKATAYFRVAQAYQGLQRMAEAKRNVLLALEVAPNFKPAQQLLLELAKTK